MLSGEGRGRGGGGEGEEIQIKGKGDYEPIRCYRSNKGERDIQGSTGSYRNSVRGEGG